MSTITINFVFTLALAQGDALMRSAMKLLILISALCVLGLPVLESKPLESLENISVKEFKVEDLHIEEAYRVLHADLPQDVGISIAVDDAVKDMKMTVTLRGLSLEKVMDFTTESIGCTYLYKDGLISIFKDPDYIPLLKRPAEYEVSRREGDYYSLSLRPAFLTPVEYKMSYVGGMGIASVKRYKGAAGYDWKGIDLDYKKEDSKLYISMSNLEDVLWKIDFWNLAEENDDLGVLDGTWIVLEVKKGEKTKRIHRHIHGDYTEEYRDIISTFEFSVGISPVIPSGNHGNSAESDAVGQR